MAKSSQALPAAGSRVVIGIIDFDTLTLLMLGDNRSLQILAEVLRKSPEVDFSSHSDLISLVNVDVSIRSTMHRSSIEIGAGTILLKLTEQDRLSFAANIEAVAVCKHPSHNYLDILPDGKSAIEIKVSKGEYDSTKLWTG
jgi:hypothetical protein